MNLPAWGKSQISLANYLLLAGAWEAPLHAIIVEGPPRPRFDHVIWHGRFPCVILLHEVKKVSAVQLVIYQNIHKLMRKN